MKEALIIIDMIVRDVKSLPNKKEVIQNQLSLIEAFHRTNRKVILVGGAKDGRDKPTKNKVMLSLWGNEISKNPEKNKIIPELLDAKYDKYINKSGYSAFYKTGLEKYCRENRISTLYFCGIFSGVCVYFSAADSAMRGIQPILVTDATTTDSKKLHQENVKRFVDIIGPAEKTNTTLKKING